jgi:hypothetical protein
MAMPATAAATPSFSVQFFVDMTCESCELSVRHALETLFSNGENSERVPFNVAIDVAEQDCVVSWDPVASGIGVDRVAAFLEEQTGLATAVHGVGALGMASVCAAMEFPWVATVGREVSSVESYRHIAAALGSGGSDSGGGAVGNGTTTRPGTEIDVAGGFGGIPRGSVRLAQLPNAESSAAAGPPRTALLDVSLYNCVPGARYGVHLREFGDFSEGFVSMCDTLAVWVDAHGDSTAAFVADERGSIRMRQVVTDTDVGSLVGRGCVVVNAEGTPVAGAVIARSAGVLVNKKKVCLCDSPAF